MITQMTSIRLSEWETRGPVNCPELANRFCDTSTSTSRVVAQLNESRRLKLTELRRGLEIQAFSHVGRVRIGDLNITILPKINGACLLNLLRYAYGFRRLTLISDSTHLVENNGFEDLLISQLNAEVQELISRGMTRAYVPVTDRLSSLRGRIDIARMVLDGGKIAASLPCRHYPRVEDTLINQVVLGGLRLAGSMASSLTLRRETQGLACLMEDQVSSVRLDGGVLDRVSLKMNRLTSAYTPALSIIRLLVESQGVSLDGQTATTMLPGFLFDMNAFFQALLSRFLRDNLEGYEVRDEHSLKGMMRYNSEFHRPKRKTPTPRPDFVLTQNGVTCTILDAKYRDLWENPLPREMLYQLVVYAISQRERPQSSILYPSADPRAKEVRIDVSDPLLGRPLGQVCLRPIYLPRIEALVESRTLHARKERVEYARQLALGEPK